MDRRRSSRPAEEGRRGAAESGGEPAGCEGGGGGLRRSVGRRSDARRPLRGWPGPEKKGTSARDCGRHRRRKASGKGRGARGRREESRGGLLQPLRTPEESTHLGGFRSAGGKWGRRRTAAAGARELRGRRRRSEEDDGASRGAFYSLGRDLVQQSSTGGGRGGRGVVRRSRPSQGYGRLGGCLGSAWEESEVDFTECGGSYGGLKFLGKKRTQVFVVDCEERGRF